MNFDFTVGRNLIYATSGNTTFASSTASRTVTVNGYMLVSGTGTLTLTSDNNAGRSITLNIADSLVITNGTLLGASNISPANISIGKKFEIRGGTFRGTSNAALTTVTASANFNMSGGTFDISSGNAAGRTNLNISGNYNQTGGTITQSFSGSVTTASVISMNGSGSTITQSGGTFNRGNNTNTATYLIFRLNNAGGHTFASNFNAPVINVNTDEIVNMGGFTITATAPIATNVTGTLF
jgi:hypothetical protein